MSCIFEGILCKTSFESIQYNINQQISSNLNLKFDKINEQLSCFSVIEDKRLFSSDLDYVASKISIILSEAILIRYDHRVGYRESVVFQEGYPIQKFDLEDEIWVILDEKRKPIINGKKNKLEEIRDDDNEEYETICNAIQLGIGYIGINKDIWK